MDICITPDDLAKREKTNDDSYIMSDENVPIIFGEGARFFPEITLSIVVFSPSPRVSREESVDRVLRDKHRNHIFSFFFSNFSCPPRPLRVSALYYRRLFLRVKKIKRSKVYN